MPNIKSAKKRVSVIAAKTAHNRIEKTALKTSMKKVSAAVVEGDKALASSNYIRAQGAIDKACAHGLLHKNTAARRKSKLARQLAAMK